MRTIIRNDQNSTMRGFTEDIGNRIEIHDIQGKMLGWYDKNNDRTFNKSGANIGRGNQLMVLLTD